MSRRAPVKPAAGIQLFPLLAVLICTMGALAALLFAFARHGQILADQAREADADANSTADLPELQWRISQLQEARTKTEAQLSDRRLELSHIEDHERRLREELERLRTSVLEMQRASAAGANERRQTSAELEDLRSKVAQAERELADARRDAQTRPVCYSVVPYQGPNQTHRRPIYIECNAESIVLQPEGIVLREADFEGPLGPGNPLAAALRAAREQMASQQNGSTKEEPYPLLVVRPDGIGAYYAARAALVSWGSEFGYELIGQDWTLQFPESDPQLRQTMRAVVSEARLRQQELVLAAPRHYAKGGGRPTFRASPHGGFVQERAPGTSGQASGAFGKGTQPTGQLAGGGSSAGLGEGGDNLSGMAGGGNGVPGASSSIPSGSKGMGDPTQLATGGFPGGTGERGGTNSARSGTSDQLGYGFESGGNASGPKGTGSTQKSDGLESSGYATAQSDKGSGQSGPRPSQRGADSQSGNGSELSGAGSSPSDPSSQAAGQSATVVFGDSRPKPASLAKKRGRDWGLPDAAARQVGLTRPVFIICSDDRLIILPEEGSGGGKEIPVGPSMQDSVDDFVAGIWQHMKSWGIAGKGLYWRPTLLVDVKPGAAPRYAELKALLADSGLDVRERQHAAPAAKATTNTTRR